MEEHAIKGATARDQAWIDDTGEAVIAGCRRERPKPRPPEWDAKAAPAVDAHATPVAKKKPRSIMDLLRRRGS